MSMEEMAYCARCRCGKLIAIMIDNGKALDKTASIIGIWIKTGLKVERHTISEASRHFTGCLCPQQEKLF